MTTFSRITDIQLTRTQRVQYGFVVAWILAMISLPIMKWVFGRDVIPTAVTFALMMQFTATLTVLLGGWGIQRTLKALFLVAIATWGIEFIGSSTEFPFGAYEYTNILQPQVGHVPLLIPLAWFMMLPSAWAVAQIIGGRNRPLLYIGISAIAITAWDLFLDPQMVDWGFWVWENPNGYFGIPWSNYAGWLLTGVVVTLIVRPYRYDLPLAPLLVIYGVVWFLQSIGLAVFWGQVGPAIVGSMAMGSILLFALHRYRRVNQQ
jgi:lycopene beta-cyclase